jgi:hypothetical protein
MKNISFDELSFVSIMQTQIPYGIITGMNDYLDDLTQQEFRQSAHKKLVGEIHSGEQLNFDNDDDRVKKLIDFILSMSKVYIKNFSAKMGLSSDVTYTLNDIWSVHQYEYDYNPIHFHNCDQLSGLSCIGYLRVPDSIENMEIENDPQVSNGGDHRTDGCLFIEPGFGGCSSSPLVSFMTPVTRTIRPRVGDFYIFPRWLRHGVYPTRLAEERRSISANVNVNFILEGLEKSPQD